MAKSATADNYVSQISLVGRASGAVKGLRGFRKQHHTVPDAVNAATSAFLAKLCTAELTEEAEGFYQRTKAALHYKRADISLDVAPPVAVLAARDFTLELEYALAADDAGSFIVTRTLHDIRNGNLVQLEEFDTLFARQFSAVVFRLSKGMKVEAVIDAIESLQDSPLAVSYPSTCSDCTIEVRGIEAQLICDGAMLEMRFPRAGSPKELLMAFAEVRSAFALAKDRVLSGLL